MLSWHWKFHVCRFVVALIIRYLPWNTSFDRQPGRFARSSGEQYDIAFWAIIRRRHTENNPSGTGRGVICSVECNNNDIWRRQRVLTNVDDNIRNVCYRRLSHVSKQRNDRNQRRRRRLADRSIYYIFHCLRDSTARIRIPDSPVRDVRSIRLKLSRQSRPGHIQMQMWAPFGTPARPGVQTQADWRSPPVYERDTRQSSLSESGVIIGR